MKTYLTGILTLIGLSYFSLLYGQNKDLNKWTYIQIDENRTKFGDYGTPDWLRYLGQDMADLNLDGYPDILAGRYIYLNPGKNMTARWKRIDLGMNIDGMLVTDIDGDEFPDIIGEVLPDIFWLEANDHSALSWVSKIVGKVPQTSHRNGQGYKVSDIIKGGKDEIILSGDGGVYICEIPVYPTTEHWVFNLVAESKSEEGIGLGDLDSDGDIDLCIGVVPDGDEEPTNVFWFSNPGTLARIWDAQKVGVIPNAADRIEIGDLNNDGMPDIVVTEERWPGKEADANLWWFESQKDGWTKHKVYTGYSLNNLDLGDIDNDGDLEIITSEHKGNIFPTMVFDNDGNGNFSKNIIDTGKEMHLGARLADMDGDGDLDIVGQAWDNYKYLHLWRNDNINDLNTWKHISSENDELPVPNNGDQQTACLTLDVNNDGNTEFFIAERTKAPALLMFKKNEDKWERFIIETGALKIEAGSAHADIDGDGDQDIIFGGESQSNEVWWWENPFPDFEPATPWVRRYIKQSGSTKHHDQLVGDFDGDGKEELVFWNQNAGELFITKIPAKPDKLAEWDFKSIYHYNRDSEMDQLGSEGYPAWKGTNEHEGLYKADIDGDGIEDIVGGGRWFKYKDKDIFSENIVDASYTFSRSIAGDFIEGGRPEIILVVGDGIAPMMMYQWVKGTWEPHTILQEVDNGHTIDVIDFNSDGHLDIFSAEMRFGEGNPDSRIRILLGDGKGKFRETIVAEGFGLHESKIVDLDGDGDYDILGKPYTWKTPRLDMWINTTGESEQMK